MIAFILPLDMISSLPLNLGILHFNCIANPCFEIHFHKRSSIITTSEVSVLFSRTFKFTDLGNSSVTFFLFVWILHKYFQQYFSSVWWSALSVEETRVPRENHSNCHKSYTNFITRTCIKYTSSWARIKLTTVNETIALLWSHHLLLFFTRDRHRMVVGFTTTFVISAYHH